MKLQSSYDPASWFLLGALVTSEPWSWVLAPPVDLAPQLLHSSGAVWRVAFGGASVASCFGFAVCLALFRSRPPRKLNVAVGAATGLSVVAATRIPLLAGSNFGPLVLAALFAGLLAGLVAAWRVRRPN